MDTIDIKIDFPAPPRETEHAIELKFVKRRRVPAPGKKWRS
jgi:hypothetical protein